MQIKGLKHAHDNDLIFSSDLDEIPNLEKFNFKKNNFIRAKCFLL